jgi:MazG family protein
MSNSILGPLKQLVETMSFLRSDHGCAWDRAQTPQSLRPYILEEAYELVDAIGDGEEHDIRSELGDLLLQVVFLSQIYTEQGCFNLGDVARGIEEKLRRRHPQLFAPIDPQTEYPDWETIKQQELAQRGKPTSYAERLPKNLPALKLAQKTWRHLRASAAEAETNDECDPTESDPTEQLAAQIYTLAGQAQQRGIDIDLALRNYVLKQLRTQGN